MADTSYSKNDIELQQRNIEIVEYNTQLRNKYERTQNEQLEFIDDNYTFVDNEVQKCWDSTVNILKGGYFTFYLPNKLMQVAFKQAALENAEILNCLGYLCKDKQTGLPISIILAAVKDSSSKDKVEKVVSSYKIDSAENNPRYWRSHKNYEKIVDSSPSTLKVIIIKHSGMELDSKDISMELLRNYSYAVYTYEQMKAEMGQQSGESNTISIPVYKISGCEDFEVYNIRETPTQYINIVLEMMCELVCSLGQGLSELFNFKGLDKLMNEHMYYRSNFDSIKASQEEYSESHKYRYIN